MPAPSEAVSLRRTPLFDVHRELGAKLIDIGGWEMPVQYEGILEEHRAVRERAGLFDVSHMGRPIGLALLPMAASAVGTELEIEIRGRAAKVRAVETPLRKKEVPS